jgi:YVTN family beta-propeller protein
VEVAFTKQGRFVWISLLRAGGVVVLDTKGQLRAGPTFKRTTVINSANKTKRALNLRFIPTGEQPKVLAVSPDEKWVFVSNWRGSGVAVIDTKKMATVKHIRTGELPRGICFSKNCAYVANFGSNTISEIDLTSLKRKRTIRDVGRNPRHLVMAEDEKSFYVSNHGEKHVRRIDIETGRTVEMCSVGTEPRTICFSRNRNFLFVTNYKANSLSVVDLKSMSSILDIDTLRKPVGASFDSSADTLWVTGYWDKAVRVYKFKSVLEPRPG